jgi:hypothetical protein
LPRRKAAPAHRRRADPRSVSGEEVPTRDPRALAVVVDAAGKCLTIIEVG